jgi:hypothetical protein
MFPVFTVSTDRIEDAVPAVTSIKEELTLSGVKETSSELSVRVPIPMSRRPIFTSAEDAVTLHREDVMSYAAVKDAPAVIRKSLPAPVTIRFVAAAPLDSFLINKSEAEALVIVINLPSFAGDSGATIPCNSVAAVSLTELMLLTLRAVMTPTVVMSVPFGTTISFVRTCLKLGFLPT